MLILSNLMAHLIFAWLFLVWISLQNWCFHWVQYTRWALLPLIYSIMVLGKVTLIISSLFVLLWFLIPPIIVVPPHICLMGHKIRRLLRKISVLVPMLLSSLVWLIYWSVNSNQTCLLFFHLFLLHFFFLIQEYVQPCECGIYGSNVLRYCSKWCLVWKPIS